jgi:hypothetical protein
MEGRDKTQLLICCRIIVSSIKAQESCNFATAIVGLLYFADGEVSVESCGGR